MNNAQIVNQIYRNLFGRDAEVDGLTYWANGLSSGNFTITNAVTTIAAGAQGTDLAAYNAKVSAATKFTAALDTVTEILNYSGATANNAAKAWLSTITSAATEVAATTTAALNATISGIVSPASAPPAAQSFNLTTNVDSVSGGAGDDVITGVVGPSGTYSVGDSIVGGGGNDTLNLIDTEGTAQGIVSLRTLETVNVRTVTADVTQLDATDWSGVATLTNASSLAGSTLQVSGLSVSTEIKLFGDTNVSGDFAGLTSGTETATLTVVGAGSGSAATALAFASAELDMDGSGLLDAITLNVSGSSYVHVEGGDDLRTLTVRGQATNLVVETTATESLSTLDASGFSGAARYFISGRTDVAVVGGGGNDTFEFGTSLNQADSVNGGAGTDTVVATLGNAVVRGALTSVEEATLTLSEAAGGGFDFSAASSVSSLFVAATAGASGSFINFAGATANLVDDDITDVTIDTAANGTLVVNVGSATGTVSVATATLTDVGNLTLQSTGSGTQTVALALATAAKTVTLSTKGSANLTVTELTVSAATTVNLNAVVSGTLSLADAVGGSALASININAIDSNAADVVFTSGGLFGNGSGGSITRTATVVASSGADVTLIGVSAGSATYSASGTVATGTLNPALVVNANAGNGSIIDLGDIVATGVSATLNLNAGVSGSVVIDDILNELETGSGLVSINISASVAQDGNVDIDMISGSGVAVNVAAVSIGASGNMTFGSAGVFATGGLGKITLGTVTLGEAATFTAGAVGAASGAAITVNAAAGAGAIFGNQQYTAGSLGSISITLGTGATSTFGTISASSIAMINVNLAVSASATFGNLGATGSGTFGGISATLATATDLVIGAINGSAASVGNITLNVASGASADIGNILAVTGGGVGFRVGDITLNVSGGGDVDMGTIGASAIGTITVSGSGDITIGTASAASVGGIDLRNLGSGGSFTINLAGITNGVVIDGGRGTSTITSGNGNDEFYLKTGEGTDRIVYTATGQGSDSVFRFEAGTADDVVRLGATGLAIISGSGTAATAQVAVDYISLGSGGTSLGADNVVAVVGTAYASVANLAAGLASGGANAVLLAASAAAAGNLAVLWSDGNDSYLSLLPIDNSENSFLGTAGDITTLATFVGVTAGSFNSGNFAFVTV